MKIQKGIKLLVLLLFVSTIQLSAQAAWKIVSSNNAKVISGKSYYLQVAKNDFFLKHKKRKYGLNWGWGKKKSPNISFHKKNSKGEINCGDKVAIHIKGGGYIKYKVRRWGLNIIWSKTPVYQWELRSVDNVKGKPIKTNALVGILNHVENKKKGDFMVYCRRKYVPVINLGWFGDCPNGARLPGKINNYSKYVNFAIKHKEKLLILL